MVKTVVVEGHVHARSSVGCPVSDGVGAVLVDEGASGVTGAPLDLDIFLRSGSTMNPEIMALCQGTSSLWSADLTMV